MSDKIRHGDILPGKKNITGIFRLSIGRTPNRHYEILNRYSVTYKNKYGVLKSKSFYFNDKKPQRTAFYEACDFLEKIGQPIGSRQKQAAIYRKFDHENLIKKKAD
jgi:hypothetical protein